MYHQIIFNKNLFRALAYIKVELAKPINLLVTVHMMQINVD